MDTTQLLKGVLDVAVLAVVDQEDGYGYDVVRRLRAGGLDGVGDASVYGTLRRLYSSGALTSYVVPSDEGPHRKYYGITPTGRALLTQQRDDWDRFSRTVSGLLARRSEKGPPGDAPPDDAALAPTQPLTQGVTR
jgi:PadR family transcriptional regulator